VRRAATIRQFLTESLALAAIGGALGVGPRVGSAANHRGLMPPFIFAFRRRHVRLNVPVLLFTLGATMFGGVLFGCAPAFQAARLNLNER